MSDHELSGNIERAWREVFFRYVGRGKFISFDELAFKSKVRAVNLRSMAAGEYNPRGREFYQILAYLPQSAVDDMMRPLGYATTKIKGEACNHGLMGAVGRTVQHFTSALEDDGVIDHKEEADGEPLVRALHDKTGEWLARRANSKAQLRAVGE